MYNRNDLGGYRGNHAPYQGGRWQQGRQNNGYIPQGRQPDDQHRKPGDIVVSAKKTVFRHPEDYRQAVSIILALLTRPTLSSGNIEPDEDGLYKIDDVVAIARVENPDISYINRDHLIEIYLKDTSRSVVLDVEKNLIGHSGGGMAVPPDLLYYGTTLPVAEKIKVRGLQSVNKPFVPLSQDEESARQKCQWYVKNQGTSMAIVVIDARGAYEDNVKFSFSGKPGEYLVDRISPRYVKEVIDCGPVVDDGNTYREEED